MSEVTTAASSASNDEIAAYVGKKAAWFERKWAIAEARKSRQSWNWAACFLGPVWMAYRCMYWQAAAVLAATLGITLVELLYVPTYFVSSALDPATIAIAVSLGWCGNSLYKRHVERRIEKLRPSATSRESLLTLLEAQGGTNWLAAAGFAVATPLLGLLMFTTLGAMY
ncbi:DUF2628 domain-containing protein [Burkholderia seminalis]|uniref:DUF2628 domain-containing protein n=1 Tax=Burkholderia seminalis TaxID=488731 RepID=UPI001453E340|nr:DUF2628 domain-containing protein [Burkholderia seminalis]MBJ9966425.1 DUF2628 domain-containing protein [Burkholderia seminalis]MCA7953487.1 DUF2628 domain-containing protein [Burkholderia seminalis]MCA8434174.1 DUF2628 domain-containing protein [Burkholderia seminalis]VWC22425.1 peptide ABC transporter permease [Burkholderia seminalis]